MCSPYVRLELYRGTFVLFRGFCRDLEPEVPTSLSLLLVIMDVLAATEEEFRSLIVRFCIRTLHGYSVNI